MPGRSRTGYPIKALLDYWRGNQQVGLYGALRVRDAHELTFTATSRNAWATSALRTLLDAANPEILEPGR